MSRPISPRTARTESGPVGPETLRASCDLLIFVYQAAEAVASYNPVKLRRGVLGKGS
jgi:hypothetical protein